ncbi:MoaD/ThiS family protein [Roseivirga sp.]|uniref:MoaD/ThiS family protein n=1 Tax=Roseivirga sp. TaxID=1964215 RepID=UPI003B8E4EC7
MNIEVTAFGIAKDILKGKQVSILLIDNHTVGGMRALLTEKYPDFEKLSSLKFAVNADYVNDDYELKVGDEVVLIPPVSGG